MDKYTIQQGDTLSGVASKYGTTVQALQSANQISNPNLIKAGVNLVIPSQSVKAENISTVTPLSVPQTPVSTVDNYATSFNNQVTEAQGGVNTAQNEVSSAQQDLLNISKQLEGKTAEQITLENQAGIPQVNQELLGLQNEAQRLSTEYLNAIRQREAQGGVAAVVGADQKRIQAQASSDIGLLNAQIQAKSGQLQMAQNTVDRAIAIKYEPLLQSLETKKMFYEMNKDNLSRADKALLEAKDKQWTLQKTQIEKQMENEKAIQNLAITASGNGAPASVLSKIAKAKSFAEAISIGGAYMSDPLDRSIKSAQLRKLQLENVANDPEKQQAIVNSVVNEKDPTKLISSFFKVNPKMKTNPAINDAAAVVSSANEMAKTLGSGKVKGYGFLGGGFLPEAFSSQESISNRSKIKALNLKVQQWASGASLTKQQTKYVMGMIPERNDTDATFRNKVNNLTNYMLSDIKGRATTQGGQFEYVPVNLFGSKDSSVMPDVKKSVVQAVSSGYKPSEVVEYVNTNFPEQSVQIQQARNAGYSDDEIIQYLSL